MVRITYYKQYHRLTVEGHALSDEPGHDLVCSGVSALAYTLAANVSGLEEKGWVRSMTLKMDPGDCEISCNPGSHFRAVVGVIFDSICVGFELMARDYPQYVTYEIRA